jgi:murein DD-endopeptidase MepM/ murein hydrolase activator NlpD
MNHFDGYRVTSQYGIRISPISKKEEFHSGIDLAKTHQADIQAFTDGKVIYSDFAPMGTGLGGFGNTVLIQDVKCCLHLYGHLDSVAVKVNDQVKKGQTIGKQGNTGQSAGSHLHYEVRTTSTPSFGWKTHTNPTEYLDKFYAEEKPKEVKVKPEKIKSVVVKAGDTLSKIAQANKLTIDDIVKLNPQIKNINLISIGDEIVIKK